MSDAPIRITTAGSTAQADLARRQRRYIISMSIRTVCFIGAAVAGMAGLTWVWPFLILAALVLPYVAVVGANANNSRADELPLMGSNRSDRQLGQK
jgi:hypothetical protein